MISDRGGSWTVDRAGSSGKASRRAGAAVRSEYVRSSAVLSVPPQAGGQQEHRPSRGTASRNRNSRPGQVLRLPNDPEQSHCPVSFPRSTGPFGCSFAGSTRSQTPEPVRGGRLLAVGWGQWMLTTLARAGAADTSRVVTTSVTSIRKRRISRPPSLHGSMAGACLTPIS